MKRLLSVLLVVALMLTLMAAAGAEGTKYVSYLGRGDIITLDFGRASDNFSGEAFYYTLAPLMRSVEDVDVPEIAKEMTVSEDGLTVTFMLRDDAKWTDGEPVKAGDFAYALLHLLDPNSANAGVTQYYPIIGAKAYNMGEASIDGVAITAPDDTTLVIKLEHTAPTLLETLKATFPIRQDYAEKFGATYGTTIDTYIGCGPFNIVKWEYEQRVTLEKNATYWNADAVKIDKLILNVVTDTNTKINLYDTGEMDFMAIPSGYGAMYAHLDSHKSLEASGNAIQLNFSNPENEAAGKALANVNFRKALSYAIDRAPMIGAINPNYLADSRLVSPSTRTSTGEYWYDVYPYEQEPTNANKEKAQEYLNVALTELGYASVAELPKFTFLLFEVPSYRMYAEALTDAWSTTLGIKSIEMKLLPIPQAIQAAISGQFDLYIQGVGKGSDPYTTLDMFTSGAAMDWCDWAGEETFTQMLADTNAIVDPASREKALFECEKFFAENGTMIPLWSYGSAYIVNPTIGLTGETYSVFSTPNVSFLYADVTER